MHYHLYYKEDLIWRLSTSGDLTLKDVYLFYAQPDQETFMIRSIWNVIVPPSKSFMIWGLFHDKISTDEILQTRGICLPFISSLFVSSRSLFFSNVQLVISSVIQCYGFKVLLNFF
jgi:hypothetical protein